jgi:hypothetical protein
MTYAIPAYTGGITAAPQFSTGLSGWQTVIPNATGSTGTGTRYEAYSSGTSKQKFLRIRVDQH